jgi:hypothetical protein
VIGNSNQGGRWKYSGRHKREEEQDASNKTEKPINLARFMAGFRKCYERDVLIILSALLLLYCGLEFRYQGGNPRSWDLLLITGLGLFIIGIYLAQWLPKRMEQTLDRLFSRRTLELDSDKLKAFKKRLTVSVNRNAQIVAIIVTILMLIAFLWAYRGKFPSESVVLAGFEAIGGYIAGFYVGRMIGYGQLGWLLKKEEIAIKVTAGHLDGVGGLKPVGDFYFFQAKVASIPAAYLAIWWFIIPFWPRYAEWREPYLGLLVIAISIEIAAFFVPMLSFHHVMQSEKRRRLKEADQLSFEITQLETQLPLTATAEEQNALMEQLSFKAKQYWAIENLPTWPFDSKTRRRFSLNNVALFLPFLGKGLGHAGLGKLLADVISNFSG